MQKTSVNIINSIRREDLNNFVYNNKYANIFQTYDISEVYKKSKDSEPLILVAVNENTDEMLATMVVRKRKEKVGFLSSFSTHSAIRGGPIFVDNESGISAVAELLQYYDRIIKKEAVYTRIYPVHDIPQIIPCFKENGYEYGPWYNILIDLNKPIDDIWRQVNKKNRRYGIRKAKQKGVEIEEINDKKLLPVFYNLMVEKYEYRKAEMHSTLEDFNYFEAVFDLLVPKKRANFFMAKHEGRYIAGLLLLFYEGLAHAWYGGSSKKREDLSLYPNDLIFWHSIEYSHKNGFHTYDFLGAGESEKMLSGPNKFKKEFGGILVNYGRFIKVHSPKKLWLSKKAFKIYRKFKLR